MEVTSTVKTAFLVQNFIGKQTSLIGANTRPYMNVQKALKKALTKEMETVEENNKEVQKLFTDFQERERQIALKKLPDEERRIEVTALTAEMKEASKPFDEQTKALEEEFRKNFVTITFDKNDYAWLKTFIEQNALFLTKNQDGSVNNEVLEEVFTFVGL